MMLSPLLWLACGKVQNPQEGRTGPPREAPKSLRAVLPEPREYYNDSAHYRIRFPSGFSLEQSEKQQEFKTRDGLLTGRLAVRPNPQHGSAAAVLAGAIQVRSPQLNVTYRVAKADWYVYSGLMNDRIVYEKAYVGLNEIRSLTMEYPAAERDRLNPLVAQLAASFESVQILTAKVSFIDTETMRTVWFEDPKLAANEVLRAYFDAKDVKAFEAVKEGDTITVEGKPSMVVLRENSDAQAGLYENRIEHSILKKIDH